MYHIDQKNIVQYCVQTYLENQLLNFAKNVPYNYQDIKRNFALIHVLDHTIILVLGGMDKDHYPVKYVQIQRAPVDKDFVQINVKGYLRKNIKP